MAISNAGHARRSMFFIQQIDYRVPQQDLRVDAIRLPALPRSRFVICEIRARLSVTLAPA